ncbi:uncharacterized protein LOC100213914 isoform X3 [Hydra vulgaris]|uniref:Uncharacterized protein LOC100213914 isoform X3 n=1 Tax=Hydra vulgaris TaxID=6087 RepID=A0ABM4C3U1_HYDVU
MQSIMSNIIKHHVEPEKPIVYEPPDLLGRKHVEKITGEFRYREDECLADKLQSEEFNKYFESNKSARKLGKMDINTAKAIFLKEVEESGLLTSSQIKELCSNDSLFAEELTRRIEMEMDLEAERKIVREMQDEEFARYLQIKEKKKLEEKKKIMLQKKLAEKRQLQLLHQESEAATNSYLPEPINHLEESEGLTDENKKKIEENDRWIAIRLQNEEALEYKRAKAERLRRKRECHVNKDGVNLNDNTYNSKVLQSNTESNQPIVNDSYNNSKVHNLGRGDRDQLEQQDEHIYLKAVDACEHSKESFCQDMDRLPNDNDLNSKNSQRKFNQLCNKLDKASFVPVSCDDPVNHQATSNQLKFSSLSTSVSHSIYDPNNPIPVRNVKRSSIKCEKNKKKWFSTK